MSVAPLGRDRVWEKNLAAHVAWMSFLGGFAERDWQAGRQHVSTG